MDRWRFRGDVSAETSESNDPEGSARIEGGPHLVAETARRLGCDASVVGMLENGEGEVLDVGRTSRTVPTRMRRALEARDGCCRFPGCGSRHTDAHHLTPWAEAGRRGSGTWRFCAAVTTAGCTRTDGRFKAIQGAGSASYDPTGGSCRRCRRGSRRRRTPSAH